MRNENLIKRLVVVLSLSVIWLLIQSFKFKKEIKSLYNRDSILMEWIDELAIENRDLREYIHEVN